MDFTHLSDVQVAVALFVLVIVLYAAWVVARAWQDSTR